MYDSIHLGTRLCLVAADVAATPQIVKLCKSGFFTINSPPALHRLPSTLHRLPPNTYHILQKKAILLFFIYIVLTLCSLPYTFYFSA